MCCGLFLFAAHDHAGGPRIARTGEMAWKREKQKRRPLEHNHD
jgi:hypothetical protein